MLPKTTIIPLAPVSKPTQPARPHATPGSSHDDPVSRFFVACSDPSTWPTHFTDMQIEAAGVLESALARKQCFIVYGEEQLRFRFEGTPGEEPVHELLLLVALHGMRPGVDDALDIAEQLMAQCTGLSDASHAAWHGEAAMLARKALRLQCDEALVNPQHRFRALGLHKALTLRAFQPAAVRMEPEAAIRGACDALVDLELHPQHAYRAAVRAFIAALLHRALECEDLPEFDRLFCAAVRFCPFALEIAHRPEHVLLNLGLCALSCQAGKTRAALWLHSRLWEESPANYTSCLKQNIDGYAWGAFWMVVDPVCVDHEITRWKSTQIHSVTDSFVPVQLPGSHVQELVLDMLRTCARAHPAILDTLPQGEDVLRVRSELAPKRH